MDINTVRAWIEIDTGALIGNLELAKSQSGKKVMCVVKANAYGQGAVPYAKILAAAGADAFAVACLSEGIELREAGITQPILILGWTAPECADRLASFSLTQSVVDEEYALALNESAQQQILEVHVKLDTGMSRTGICAVGDPRAAAEAVIRINRLPNLRVRGVFTHFAAAENPQKDAYTHWQIHNYGLVLDALQEMGFREPIIRHVGNSAAILRHKEELFDMVRMGIMMHGLYPDGKRPPASKLQTVMSFKARVAQVRVLPAGSFVGYGCTYENRTEARIAVITAGYADGYPWRLGNRGAYAVINGHRCPQIGNVCMDMCMFDVSGLNVRSGDEAILFGRGGMPLEEVAELCGTIDYETLCLITERVKRVYL